MAVIVARDSTEAKRGGFFDTPQFNHKFVLVAGPPTIWLRRDRPDPSIRCTTEYGALNYYGRTHLFDNRFVGFPRCHWSRRCILCNMWFSLEEDASPTDWPHDWGEAAMEWFARPTDQGPLHWQEFVLTCADCGARWDMRVDDDEEPVKGKIL
jgi:hypothetical protein